MPLPQQPRFQTMILDIWGETSREGQIVCWRFRLRDVRTGEHLTFRSSTALNRYLEERFGHQQYKE